ncbi:hypothetical protein CLU79DRAFT_844708 [Phycomyces nitens]|nr:hypothetical protein CLU79DRAFT_844708 [Phycomyces nitens]
MASVGGSLFPLLVVLLVLLVETHSKSDSKGWNSDHGHSPTVKKTDQARKKTCRQEDSKKWNPNHGQSPTVKMTGIKEGYRPTVKPVPKEPNLCLTKTKSQSPKNQISNVYLQKSNAKFKSKSSAKFNCMAQGEVRSNVWCGPMRGLVQSPKAKFDVKLDFRVQRQVRCRV